MLACAKRTTTTTCANCQGDCVAIGMNNPHMGSAGLLTRGYAKLVQELKCKICSFLIAHHWTQCGENSQRVRVASLDRHFFLDDKDTYADVNVNFNVQCITHKARYGNRDWSPM